MVVNYDGSEAQPDDVLLVTGAVPPTDAGNLTVTGPTAQPGGEPFDLNLSWNLPDLQAGDRWYGTVDVGTSPETPGDLGRMLVDIVGGKPPMPYQIVFPALSKNVPSH
jgi:hypothetical protein